MHRLLSTGIGDKAALTIVQCEMPTKDENVTVTGQCGAVLKGPKLVFIASRISAGQVAALLRTAATHM